MYQVANIEANITESQGLYSEPIGIEVNGLWERVSEDYFGPLFIAAHNREIFKAEMATHQTSLGEIFPDPTWLTVAVVDRSEVRTSNRSDVRHIEDLVDEPQIALEGGEGEQVELSMVFTRLAAMALEHLTVTYAVESLRVLAGQLES